MNSGVYLCSGPRLESVPSPARPLHSFETPLVSKTAIMMMRLCHHTSCSATPLYSTHLKTVLNFEPHLLTYQFVIQGPQDLMDRTSVVDPFHFSSVPEPW